MGGDFGPGVVVPAAIDALKACPELSLILVGQQEQIKPHLEQFKGKYSDSRLFIHHASEVVGMDESPALALRGKKDSSMRVAINLVKEQKAQACVSAGNTGALMATARFVLKMLPGIDRPAIIYSIPNKLDTKSPSHMRMLDLGANVDCTSEHLYQFAVMGAVLAKAMDGKTPRVGLLNIGSEAIKGSESVKKAAELLNDSELNYIGFVEGTDIFEGSADVVVCDGFVGNVALKISEGIAGMLMRFIKQEFKRNIFTKIMALISAPVLLSIKKKADPSQYNGASLLGLNGIVIKSHGNAQRQEYTNAILEAVHEAQNNIPDLIRSKVAYKLKQEL
jgi:glycerol-3-phosphate acyltransferase PlsX